MIRLASILSVCFALTACAVPDPEIEAAVDLGDFRLKSNIAVTKTAQKMGVRWCREFGGNLKLA
ncbi:MAG: hypothetical protein OXC60_13120 [Litoreibacter sp.]|nr:hypothetical protein [Litoreibacter sp.]